MTEYKVTVTIECKNPKYGIYEQVRPTMETIIEAEDASEVVRKVLRITNEEKS